MPEPTWTFSVDLNSDCDWADANEDISSYVVEASWNLGFGSAYDTISRASSLTLVLKNSDQRFSPEYSSGALYPNFTRGKIIKVESTYSAVTRTHWIGWIVSIRPAPGIYRERVVQVDCEGFMAAAQDSEVSISVQESVTADEVLTELISRATIVPAPFCGKWKLGLTNFSELGQKTYLSAITDLAVLDTGISTFAYIGDQWGGEAETTNWGNQYGQGVTANATSLYAAMRDVAGREVGRVFVNRDGKIEFWNRTHLVTDTTSDASFDNTMVQMDYAYGEELANEVIVQANTRTVGGSPETLGTLDKATLIDANDTKTITFRYANQNDGSSVGGKDIVTPVATTDYTANSAEDGTGVDYTSSVTAAVNEEGGNSCQILFTNNAPVDVYIDSGARVRGTKITDYGQVNVVKSDDTSIAAYRRQRWVYGYTLDDVSEAEGVASYFLSIRKDPVGTIKTVSFKPYTNATLLTQAVTRTMGDRVTISEDQTGIDAKDYFIIGEAWRVTSKDCDLTWILEPAAPSNYWILGSSGFSELTDTSTIGPF